MKLECVQCLFLVGDLQSAIDHVKSTGHLITGTTADGDTIEIGLTNE